MAAVPGWRVGAVAAGVTTMAGGGARVAYCPALGITGTSMETEPALANVSTSRTAEPLATGRIRS